MNDTASHPVINDIANKLDSLSPKARVLGKYIMQHPNKAVFMTTKELSENSGVSEATVVRFVAALGFKGYSDFQQALKDFVNTGMSLPDRADMKESEGAGLDRLHRGVLEEINNLKFMYETVDLEKMNRFVDHLIENPSVYITGSRLSYTFAYYLGWSVMKIRKGVQVLKGSDSVTMDVLSNAPENSLVVLFATTRYPNELIRLSKMAKRLGHTLLVVTDSNISPVIQFADLSLVVPTRSIPYIGSVSNMMCIIQYLVQELASRKGDDLKKHQEHLEQIYLENDILFNLLPR